MPKPKGAPVAPKGQAPAVAVEPVGTTKDKTVKTALWIFASAAVMAGLEAIRSFLAGDNVDPNVVALGTPVVNILLVFVKNFFDPHIQNS